MKMTIHTSHHNPPPFSMFTTSMNTSHQHNRSLRATTIRALLAALCWTPLLASATSPEPAKPIPAQTIPQLSPKDFTFGYYPNGWKKNPKDTFPGILSIETGYYGFKLDVGNLSKPSFGLLNDDCDYKSALADGIARLDTLSPADLKIEVKLDGKVYRAVSCAAGRRTDVGRMSDARLWESGRFVQHFDFADLKFADEAGNPLSCQATLDLVAWPDSLTLTANMMPATVPLDGAASGVVGAGLYVVGTPLDLTASKDIDPASFTAECWFKFPENKPYATSDVVILSRNQNKDADGHYGFTLSPSNFVSAVMNVGGNKENTHSIPAGRILTPDAWHLLALIYDGKTMSFYVDGRLAGTKAIARERKPGGGALLIGKSVDPASLLAQGVYDQIRIWDRVLTHHEIINHTQQPANIANRTGLVFEENFDAFNGKFTPPIWTNAEVTVGLKSGSLDWTAKQVIQGQWKEGETKGVSVTCDVRNTRLPQKDISIRLLNQDGPVAFNPVSNCNTFLATHRTIKRTWDISKSPDLREYDEFLIEVDNKGTQTGNVPFLLDFTNPGSITGICPILCKPDGTPTGIPVQLSKNWHHNQLMSYLRAYTFLPAPTGKTTYLMRVVYGFYGNVPQGTHAQLSLASDARWGNGGGNGRWDQIAVGAWGETLCLDMDYSLSSNIITDNRGMLIRSSKEGKMWDWVEAGWGGNWLETKDEAGKSRFYTSVKTAYLSHGPCLSDVRYDGYYGKTREVDLQCTVRVPRCDDYVRILFDQSYSFKATIPTKGCWLFNMGGGHRLATPRVAYGNRDGLIAEIPAPAQAKTGDLVVDHLELKGEGPWWIAYPDADVQLPPGREHFGKASRALVIRSYKAKFGGKIVTNPSLSLSVHTVQGPGKMDIDCLLVPPKDVAEFQPGDRVDMELEWITVPRNADEYYGPNEALRQHLTESPRSWKTIHREAAGNDLTVTATGGVVTRRYPIFIEAEEPLVSMDTVKGLLNKLPSSLAAFTLPARVVPWLRPSVTVDIKGGVGYVPIRFERLPIADGYRLYEEVAGKLVPVDQTRHGNDFWQADFDAFTKTYSLTYNLPLDGKPTSRWVLKAEK